MVRSGSYHLAAARSVPTDIPFQESSDMNPHQVRVVALVLVAILVLGAAASIVDGLIG